MPTFLEFCAICGRLYPDLDGRVWLAYVEQAYAEIKAEYESNI
jgi:hypothetical protein